MAQVDLYIPSTHHMSVPEHGYLDPIHAHFAVSASPASINIAQRYLGPSAEEDNMGASSLPTPPPDEPVTGEFPSTLPIIAVDGLPSLSAGAPHDLMRSRILQATFDAEMNEPDAERAFFVADLSKVYQQYTRWRRCLPDIEPFYAVKCNPDPYVLRLLAALGTGFDCASHGEIKQVLDIGVAPSRIIFANPCKSLSFIRHASKMGVDAMTFDNTDELYKIARTHRGARLVVRILTDDSKSLCRLGLKFGAPLSTVPALLSTARELGLNVVGVSFHVGSGCYDSNAFEDAIARAASAFEMGRDAGYRFTLLDVGGGFESPNFEATAGVLRRAIQEHFPFAKQQGVQIIAEPGRYFVAEAFQLATNIIARRVSPNGGEGEQAGEDVMEMEMDEVSSSVETGPEQPSVMYYINDGVYGSFNCIMFDHQKVTPLPLTIGRSPVPQFGSSADQGLDKLSSVWGPTCDSIDCVAPLCTLPDGLDVGDWLGFENMGAYTICAASNFNGFDTSSVHYTSGAGAIESATVRRALAHYNSKGSATLY